MIWSRETVEKLSKKSGMLRGVVTTRSSGGAGCKDGRADDLRQMGLGIEILLFGLSVSETAAGE